MGVVKRNPPLLNSEILSCSMCALTVMVGYALLHPPYIYCFTSFQKLKRDIGDVIFWARGYFCVYFGQVTEDMIKNYTEHHFEPKPDDNFKTEYRKTGL